MMFLTSLGEADGLFGKLLLKVARTYLSSLFRFVYMFFDYSCCIGIFAVFLRPSQTFGSGKISGYEFKVE